MEGQTLKMVDERSYVPSSSVVRPFCNIINSVIGNNTKIGAYTEINNAVIGNNCKIQAKCFIPKGVIIEDNCFIGPGVIFTNDKYPPSGEDKWLKTLVKKGARIGAGAVILPGITIGKNAMVGAGSVVVQSVLDGQVVAGNPAKPLKKYDL